MSARLVGPRWWESEIDDDGYKTYTISFRVRCSSRNDGPNVVMNCPGLPVVGSPWNFFGDYNAFALRTFYCKATPVLKDESNGGGWDLELKFSTKPPEASKCQENTYGDDPLLEPPKISGGVSKYQRYIQEGDKDVTGKAIQTSSHQTPEGLAFDACRPTVKISQNFGSLSLFNLSKAINKVNSIPMWGLAARQVMLTDFSWERKIQGTCVAYYSRELSFEVRNNDEDPNNTFDYIIFDKGTKVLNGHWENDAWQLDNIGGELPDRFNPSHFIGFPDKKGNLISGYLDQGQPLNGSGETVLMPPKEITVKWHRAFNFFTLGIPASL